MVNEKFISLFKNFTLGFIIFGLITPAINKKMCVFSNNLILVRELLEKIPFSIECKISELVMENLQVEHLRSLVEVFSKKANANIEIQASKSYRGAF